MALAHQGCDVQCAAADSVPMQRSGASGSRAEQWRSKPDFARPMPSQGEAPRSSENARASRPAALAMGPIAPKAGQKSSPGTRRRKTRASSFLWMRSRWKWTSPGTLHGSSAIALVRARPRGGSARAPRGCRARDERAPGWNTSPGVCGDSYFGGTPKDQSSTYLYFGPALSRTYGSHYYKWAARGARISEASAKYANVCERRS